MTNDDPTPWQYRINGVMCYTRIMASLFMIKGHALEITGEPAMSSVFAIYNLVTKKITTTAPTPELIEREYVYTDAYFPKRDMTQVICEIPTMFGLTIHNYRDYPEQVILDGIALYGRRKAGA